MIDRDLLQHLLETAKPGTRLTIVIVDTPRAVTAIPSESIVERLASAKEAKNTDTTPMQSLETRTRPFTAAEVAEILQVEPTTIQKWCREGRFSGARNLRGAGWRIAPSAIVAFLNESQVGRAETRLPEGDEPHASENIARRDDGGTAISTSNRSAQLRFDAAELSAWRSGGSSGEHKCGYETMGESLP